VAALPPSLAATLGGIWSVRVLRETFAVACLSQAVFQAAYHTLLILLPEFLGTGPGGIAVFQLAGGAGLAAGFYAVWSRAPFTDRQGMRLLRNAVGFGLGIGVILAATLPEHLGLALAGFGAVLCVYEMLYLDHQACFFAEMPGQAAGRCQHALSAIGGALASVFSLGYALAVQWAGLAAGSACYAGVMLVFVTVLFVALVRARAAETVQGVSHD
jgi:hypothetical protein